ACYPAKRASARKSDAERGSHKNHHENIPGQCEPVPHLSLELREIRLREIGVFFQVMLQLRHGHVFALHGGAREAPWRLAPSVDLFSCKEFLGSNIAVRVDV